MNIYEFNKYKPELMKKFISLLVVFAMEATALFAQDAREFTKEQYRLDKILLKLMNVKPTAFAKEEAKKYENDGWLVPAGEMGIATQITKSQIYADELMRDDSGITAKRYVQSTAIATAKSYNTAYNMAIQNAKVEIATSLQTEIVAAMQTEMDNNSVSATSVEDFNIKASAITKSTLTNTMTSIVLYRRHEDKDIESMVRIVFDKMELAACLKREMLKQMELDSKDVEDIVATAVRNL